MNFVEYGDALETAHRKFMNSMEEAHQIWRDEMNAAQETFYSNDSVTPSMDYAPKPKTMRGGSND
jgi:hypothetical protein